MRKIWDKILVPVFILLLFALFLFWGIKRGEPQEVEFNGNILCLSCIGIE